MPDTNIFADKPVRIEVNHWPAASHQIMRIGFCLGAGLVGGASAMMAIGLIITAAAPALWGAL